MAKNFETFSRLVAGELYITSDQKKTYKITMSEDTLKILHRSNSTDSFVINKDGSFTLPLAASSTPSSPSSGGTMYVKDDGKLYFINSSGTEYDLTETAEAGDGSGDITGVSAGVGISGGGTSGDVTVTLDASELSALGTAPASGDYVVIQDVTDNSTKKVLVSNLISNTGDIQGVTAGTGLSGGGTSGTVTLTLDLASVISGDGANRILTSDADGTLTAESGLTFDGSTLSLAGDLNVDSNILFVDASDDDVRIGTGTAVSSEKLLVRQATRGLNTGIMLSKGTSSGDEYLSFDISGVDTAMITAGVYNTGDCALVFRTSDTNEAERMKIKADGDVEMYNNLSASMGVSGSGFWTENSYLNHTGHASVLDLTASTIVLGGTTITATGAELNYADGVTSNIQTQLNAKHATISSGNRLSATLIGANGNVSNTEYGYLNGVSSNIQTQFDAKAPVANPTFTGEIGIGSVNVSETELGILEGASLSTTELNYVDGVTSAVQTQIDSKVGAASPTFTGNATFDTNTLYVDGTNNKVGIGTTSPYANLSIDGDHDGGVVSIRLGNNSGTGQDYSARLEMAEDTNGSKVMTHGASIEYDGDASDPDYGMLHIGMRDSSTSDTKVVTVSRKSPANSLVLAASSVSASIPVSASCFYTENSYLNHSGHASVLELTASKIISNEFEGPTNDLNIKSYGNINLTIDSNNNSTNDFTINAYNTEILNLDESGNLQIDGSLTIGSTTVSSFGKTLIDDANASTARTTLGVDAAGTDNSTNVTIASGRNYITISGQQLTLGEVDISDDTNLAAGTGLDLSGDTLSVDVSDFMANGSNNRVVTATGADGMNAEANLTFGTQLHVTRGATVGDIGGLTLGNAGVKITDSGTNMYIDGNSINTDGNTYVNVSSNHDLYFGTNDTERMRIENNGLVGIGTSSPNAGLHINISGEPQLLLDGGDNSHGDIVVPTDEILQVGHWDDAGDTYTHRFRINGDGSIDIAGLLTANEVSATTLDIGGTNITATAAELNYCDGVTSNIQTQLGAKHATIDSGNRLSATLVGSNGNISNTEYGYLNGVTSAIQTQLDGKLATGGNAATATSATNATNASKVDVSTTSTNGNYRVAMVDASGTGYEQVYVDSGLTFNPSTERLTAGDITVSDELFVNDYARIDALRVGTTSTDPGDGNLYVEGDATVAGDLTISAGTSGDAKLIITADTDNNNENDTCFIEFKQDGSNAWGGIYTTSNELWLANSVNAAGGIVFATDNSNSGYTVADERMRIAPDGNIGIGTVAPQVPLDIVSGSVLLSQTIIDGVSTQFQCETSSTTYKQINDDTTASKKASITFTVPNSRKVLVTLRMHMRDYDASQHLWKVRITDEDAESTQGSWGDDFNDEQWQGHEERKYGIVTCQWYFDGTNATHNWTGGQSKTMYFQIKVHSSIETVGVRAGVDYAPLIVTAESVPVNATFVDMDN